jgi:hypothetical protein
MARMTPITEGIGVIRAIRGSIRPISKFSREKV